MPDSASSADEFTRAALGHLQDVFRVARRLSGDASLAADLTQETFLQAWVSFHKFQSGTNCRAWLYRILLNVWSHERRRRSREPILFDSATVENEAPFYDQPLPDNVTEAHVLAALNRLVPTHRAIVILADVEDLTYREIAEVLEIPIGTVMSRLSRARRTLRHELVECARSVGIGLRSVSEPERQ